MNTVDEKILDNYFGLLNHLNPTLKMELIDRLKESVKSENPSKSTIKLAFGAWHSDESAEELINSIRISRRINRDIENF